MNWPTLLTGQKATKLMIATLSNALKIFSAHQRASTGSYHALPFQDATLTKDNSIGVTIEKDAE
jgi:hypothetical protein